MPSTFDDDPSDFSVSGWEWLLLFALLFAAAAVFVAVGLFVAGLCGFFE